MLAKASSRDELAQILDQWGKGAPPRLKRRGKPQQRALERWCLSRAMANEAMASFITYPLKIFEDENPDFQLHFEGRLIGMEVTEAADPEEQKLWTSEAKVDVAGVGSDVRSIDPRWLTGNRYARLVQEAVTRKNEKCSNRCDQLLVYLNTHDDMFDELSVRQFKIAAAIQGQRRFESVWVLSGGHVMRFPKTIAEQTDFFMRVGAKPRDVIF